MSTYYVTQAGAGDGSGSSLANAKAVASITAFIALTAGDILRLSGAFTSQLVIPSSGSAGNEIQIVFEAGAKFSAAVWSSGAIYAGHKSYLVINGDQSNGRQGVIECTDNGTNLGNKSSAYGVRLNTCHHVTVKNLTISNIYVRVEGTETNDYGHGVSCYYGSGDDTMNNIIVTNCLIHDAYIGCWFSYVGTCTDLEFSNSEVYNTNWCGAAGNANNTATLDGLRVYGNWFHDWTCWDETASVRFHHNGFFTWGNSGGEATGVKYYNNKIGPNFTNAVGGNHSTSGLFVQNSVLDVLIYNNIFVATDDNPSTGFIYLNPGAWVTSAYRIYNNTWTGALSGIGINFTPASTGAGTQTVVIRNNIIEGVETAISIFNNETVSLSSNKNIIYQCHATKTFSISDSSSSWFRSFSQWQDLGYDLDSVDSDPYLTDYIPSPISPAVGVAEDLSAYFNTDYAWNIRLPPWDIGAYMHSPKSFKRLGRRLKFKVFS